MGRFGLTMDTLLDELGLRYTSHISPALAAVRFQWPKLARGEEPEWGAEYLRVCLLSEALGRPRRESCCLCLRDRIADDAESDEAMAGLVVINENVGIIDLFNRVQDVFIRINSWIHRLQESVAEHRGIQDLVDLSEPILQNDISVLDSSFKLLAHTKNVISDDYMIPELLHLGCHPESFINELHRYRHIEHYRKTEETLIDRSGKLSRHIALEKAFHSNGTFTVQVVMLCCGRPFTDGLLPLFEIFCHYVKIYAKRGTQESAAAFAPLLLELVENGRFLKPATVTERAKNVNLPMNGHFNFCKITFGNTENTPLNRLAEEVSALMSSRCIAYSNWLVVFNVYTDQKSLEGECADKLSRLEPLLKKYSAFCGVSNSFHSLLQVQTACEQADIALKYGRKQSARRSSGFYFFRDWYSYFLLDCCMEHNPDLLVLDDTYRALKVLKSYDAFHKSTYLRLLSVYPGNDKRTSSTEAAMHMTRNNVAYHLKRIFDLTGLDLDAPGQTLNLMLSFRLLELCGE